MDAAAKQPRTHCPPGDSLSAGGGQTPRVIDQDPGAPVPAESPLSGVRASSRVPIKAIASVPERLDRLDLIARRRRQAMLAHGDCERRIKAFVRFLLEDAGEPLSKKQPVTAAHVRRFADNLVIVNLMYVRKFLSAWRTQEEKLLCELAQGLPALDWWTSVNGLGVLGYALLVSESGALSNYPDQGRPASTGVSTLWRRFGLHVVNGKACATWKGGGLTAEQWSDAGYSSRRRSLIFQITSSLLKRQNPYKALYDSRKRLEAAKAPDGPKMLWHRRAERYVSKRLLRDLWRAWRDQRSYAVTGHCVDVSAPAEVPLSGPAVQRVGVDHHIDLATRDCGAGSPP